MTTLTPSLPPPILYGHHYYVNNENNENNENNANTNNRQQQTTTSHQQQRQIRGGSSSHNDAVNTPSRLRPVDLVGVVVDPLERLPDGDRDDVRHHRHQQALDREVAPIARQTSDAFDLSGTKTSPQRGTALESSVSTVHVVRAPPTRFNRGEKNRVRAKPSPRRTAYRREIELCGVKFVSVDRCDTKTIEMV